MPWLPPWSRTITWRRRARRSRTSCRRRRRSSSRGRRTPSACGPGRLRRSVPRSTISRPSARAVGLDEARLEIGGPCGALLDPAGEVLRPSPSGAAGGSRAARSRAREPRPSQLSSLGYDSTRKRPAMSLIGTLDEIKIADVLRLFASGKKTGRLTVTDERRQTTLRFQKGALVHASVARAPVRRGRGPRPLRLDGGSAHLRPRGEGRSRPTCTRGLDELIVEGVRWGTASTA